MSDGPASDAPTTASHVVATIVILVAAALIGLCAGILAGRRQHGETPSASAAESTSQQRPTDPTPPPPPSTSTSQPVDPAGCTIEAVAVGLGVPVTAVSSPVCHDGWGRADVCMDPSPEGCVDPGVVIAVESGRWTRKGALLQDCAETFTTVGAPAQVAAEFYPPCNTAPQPVGPSSSSTDQAGGDRGETDCGVLQSRQHGERVSVAEGRLSCAEARSVVQRYIDFPPDQLQGSGGAADFDGWSCISTSGDEANTTGHYGDCENGTVTISIDRP